MALIFFMEERGMSMAILPAEVSERRRLATLMAVIAAICIAACVYIYGEGLNSPVVRSDGFGYYSYLPAAFVDHDLSYTTLQANLPPHTHLESYGIARHSETGKWFTKYPIGTAIMETPSFLVAYIGEKVTARPATGYSRLFQYANVGSSIGWLLIGILMVYGALRRWFDERISLLTVTLLAFATNLFHYATYDGSFSHVYSFAAFAIVLRLALAYRDATTHRARIGFVVACGAFAGLATIIRIPNGFVVLLPACVLFERLWNERDLRRFATASSLCVLAWFVALLPQLVYQHATTGKFLANTYAESFLHESFNWTHPELFNFLFSIRKGFFFWAPVMLLAVAGIPSLFRKDRWLAAAITAIFVIEIYVCASWYSWFFGASYGSRPLVDIMALLALPLAAGLDRLVKAWSRLVYLGAFVAIALSLTMTFSYWKGYVKYDKTDYATMRALPGRLFN
ncbi:MAG TPA: hypothetical protein VGM61_18350 [Pinirhizobacter sp.]